MKLMSRINRFKEQGTAENAAKLGMIQKKIENLRVDKVRVDYNRGISEVIKLKVFNNNDRPRCFNLQLFDEDGRFLKKP